MLEINLLPEELRKKSVQKEGARAVDVTKIPIRLIAVIAIAAFIGIQLLAAGVLVFKKGTLNRLDKSLAKLEPEYKVAQSLKLKMRLLSNNLSAINELTSKSILWSKKMLDLSSTMTEGVWLSELSLQDKKGRQAMVLHGSAVSYPEREEAALIGNFINSLKSNLYFFEDFEDLQLESSQMRKTADMEVMDFVITCYFKKGRSYFDRSEN